LSHDAASPVRAMSSTPEVSRSMRWQIWSRSSGYFSRKSATRVFFQNFAVVCMGSPAGLSMARKVSSLARMPNARGTSGSIGAGRSMWTISPARTAMAGRGARAEASRTCVSMIVLIFVRERRRIRCLRK